MKKAIVVLPLIVLVLLPVAAFAVGHNFGNPPSPVAVSSGEGAIYNLLDKAFTVVYTVFFAVATFFILFAAFTYLTAGGDEAKLGKAKSTLIYAVIAIVVALIALSLTNIVSGFITGI